MKLKGKILDGLKAASWTIPRQKSFFKKYIEDIDRYQDGTINLLLEAPLIIYKPDIETEPIEWLKGSLEKFGFLKIKFETIPSQEGMPLDALIYIPYGSPHFPNPFYKEILAPKIDLSRVEYCNVIIDKKMREITGYIID
jgi:hypothetical protein